MIIEISKTSVKITHTSIESPSDTKLNCNFIYKSTLYICFLETIKTKAKFPYNTLCFINTLLLPLFIVFHICSVYSQSYISDKMIFDRIPF